MGLDIENNIVRRYTFEDDETDVVIPYGVTEIGHSAFVQTPLTSVIIPDTVTVIGNRAFAQCSRLTTLYIPDNVTSIGNYAFENCKNLVTNLSIRQWDRRYGLEKPDYALNYMRHYQSGDPFFDNVRSDNNKYIQAHRDKLIRKITVSDTAVVSYFTREIRLTADNIDYLLERLGENVEITAMLLDYKNKNFTEEYLEHIETERFEKEVGIRERTLSDWKKIYKFGRNKAEGGYILRQYNGRDTDVMIPDHIAGEPVTRIGKYCFYPNGTDDPDIRLVREKIRSVYIPDTVICVETRAFRECKSLTEITIPNSVVNIENCAFEFCSSLTEVTLPKSLAAIPYGLFLLCKSLTRINIPDSVTEIGANAFSSCLKLTEIDIPDSVEKIGSSAFSSCTSLKRVTLPKGLKTISQHLFSMCKALAEIEIPKSVTLIQSHSFYGCLALTEITLPNNITSIEPSAFGCCTSLERITLPHGLKKIEDCAFAMCINLHEIAIPPGVEFIDQSAFEKSSGIVIKAPRGSYAIKYAKEYGFKFKEI